MFRSSKTTRNGWAFFLGCIVMMCLLHTSGKHCQHSENARRDTTHAGGASQTRGTKGADDDKILLKLLSNGDDVSKHNDGTSLFAQNAKRSYLDEPVDPHWYDYTHNPKRRCLDESRHKANIFLTFLVSSTPENSHRRELIRATYGNDSEWQRLGKNTATRTVFLLGATKNATLQHQIDAEFDLHRDIVQERFADNYLNLTIKTVMGLKWFTRYCKHARYVMKIDDDSVINQARLMMVLVNASATNYTASKRLTDITVPRTRTMSRFFLSEEFYPHSTFPPYMDGAGYILSTDVAQRVYRMATAIPRFPWEDVFTGICLKKLGIPIELYHRFLFRLNSKYTEKQRANKLHAYSVVTNILPREMMWMWEMGRI